MNKRLVPLSFLLNGQGVMLRPSTFCECLNIMPLGKKNKLILLFLRLFVWVCGFFLTFFGLICLILLCFYFWGGGFFFFWGNVVFLQKRLAG
ncbi:hypothetical protein [Alysiella filiformis]|uniref:hypothetical protein n=1 Tax=Alysiella filiformis TaxID=194196 RepID=UPI0011781EEE|nr:hypothetical protein [Alysiella filiformis]QMT31535.1 hypothetical protein H3L97_01090 [Alysiella filiformis]UBQ55451.1 hypothetical protein JF568_07585 [Alysiella filiformis DSM 16848]